MCFFDDQAKMLTACLGNLDSYIVCTRHCTFAFSIHFNYKILFMEKISILWKSIKGIWNSSLLKKNKKFGEDEIMNLPDKLQKVVEQNGEYIVQ